MAESLGTNLRRGLDELLRSIRLKPLAAAVPDPSTLDFESDLAYYRDEQDPLENSEGAPPADETLRHNAIWVVEIYPPSKVQGLIDGLERLGPVRYPDHRPSDWVENVRRRLYAGAWCNLGYIVRKDSNGFIGSAYRTELPDGISHVIGGLTQLVPSVTVGVFCFVIQEGLDRQLEETLRRTFATYRRNEGGGRWSVQTPANQRVDAAVESRRAIRERCERWLTERLPGFFAQNHERGYFACEFISTATQRLFERVEVPDGPSSEWLWSLHLDSPVPSWESESLPGLRLGRSYGRDQWPYAWVIGGRWGEIFTDSELERGHGGRTRNGIASLLDDHIHQPMAVMGFSAFVQELGVAIARLRDRGARLAIDGGVESAVELMKLQADLAGVSNDLLPLVDELETLTDRDSEWPRKDSDDFIQRLAELRKGGGLLTAVRRDLREHAKLLRQVDAAVRLSVEVAAAALNARVQGHATAVNLELQLAMKRLTHVAIWIAVVALIVSVLLGLPQALEGWETLLGS